MIRNLKTVLTGAAALAIAGGMMFGGAGAAHAAAGDPTFETPTGNPGTQGSVGFFDTTGTQIYSGTVTDDPIAAYFSALGGPANGGGIKAGDNVATAFTYAPQDNKPADQWTTPVQLTGGDTFGTAAASASYPGVLHNSTKAIAVGLAGGTSVNDSIAQFALASVNDPGILQVRITTSQDASKYYSTDIKITGSTWTQVFPAPPAPAKATTTTLTASPEPSVTGDTVTLTATTSASDATHPAGSVQFKDGANNLGAAVAVNASGIATTTSATLTQGAHNLSAVYTPTDTTYPASTGTFTATVNAPAPAAATTTTISGSTGGTVGTQQPVHADVKKSSDSSVLGAGTGSVQFTVDGANLGAVVPLGAAGADIFYNPADTSPHVLSAKFIPANSAIYAASQVAAGSELTVTAAPSATTPDPQNVDANVPAGSLVISTPYTVANPFHLGDLVLSNDGTSLNTADVNFGDATKPATPGSTLADAKNNGVTITDTRPGSLGWSAYAFTTDFTNGANLIDGNKLQFFGLAPKYISGNAIQSGVNTHDLLTGFKAQQKFADTTQGPGTVNITGKMSLSAPTSTKPGLYTATVTFTIV